MWLGCQEKKAEGAETQNPNPVLMLATGAPVKVSTFGTLLLQQKGAVPTYANQLG